MKKTYFTVMVLALLSFQSFATTASSAVKNLLDSGVYQGKNCEVTVEIKNDLVIVNVESADANLSFGLLDSLKNYSVDQNGDLRASQNLRFPKYDNGGVKHLTIRNNPSQNGVVDVVISEILFDHKGNDLSQFAQCSVLK